MSERDDEPTTRRRFLQRVGPKILAATPGRSGTLSRVIFASSRL